MPVEGVNGILNVESAALHAPQVGIANTNPQHILSVGSNLYVSGDSPDVLTVDGNVVCEGVKVGLIEIIPSYDLEAVANVGNSTSNTIQFTNPGTGIVTTGNVTVGKDLNVTGNLNVLGTTTTIDTENLRVKDPIIELGKDNPGTGDLDLGLVMTRPSGSSNVAVIFDESADTLEIGYTQSNASDTDIAMRTAAIEPLSVNVNGNVSVGKELNVTGNVAVGTNKLFVDTVGGTVGIGSTLIDITDNTLSGAGNGLYIHNPVQGGHLLTLGTQRPWVFEQGLSDASTELCLRSLNSGKKFNIQSPDHSNVMTVVATNGGGNVGIGTTNPSKTLDIGFVDYGSPGIRFTHTDPNGIDRVSSGYEGFFTGIEAVIERYADKNVRYTGSNVPEVTHRINLGYSDSYLDNNGFYPQFHEMHFEVMNKVGEGDSTATLDRIMTLRGDGNVGIGTTDPKAPLHVNQNKAIINGQMSLQTLIVYKNAGGNSGSQTKRYYRVYVPNSYANFQIILQGFARNYTGSGDIQAWRRQYTVQRNSGAVVGISHDSGENINATGFTFATSTVGSATSVIEVHFDVTFPPKPEAATYISFTAQLMGDTGYFAENTSS
jgi:hypothetical protein